MDDELPPRTRTQDGRNIDPALGVLAGEASQIAVKAPASAFPVEPGVAEEMAPELAEKQPGYYSLPLLKPSVWRWPIPTYLFLGGAAGASSLLGAALALRSDPRGRRLARRARWMAAAGDLVSTGLLISDLGRPSRFLNMLRVFRPSSPMNVGSWILAASGAANAAAVLLGDRTGAAGGLGKIAALCGGALGMPLAGYTGVLLSTTAVPVWQESRRSLPILFMSSGMAAAASLLELLPSTRWEERALGRYAIAGKVGELAATLSMQAESSRVRRVGRPLRSDASGALLSAATALTAASLIASLWPGRGRKRRVLGALAGTLGSLVLRFAVVEAGKSSARDPQASFDAQRAARAAKK